VVFKSFDFHVPVRESIKHLVLGSSLSKTGDALKLREGIELFI
jgi:hypothetical protein